MASLTPGLGPQYLLSYISATFLFGGQVTALPFASGKERKGDAASDSVRMWAIVNRLPDRIRLDRDCERF